MAAAKEKNITEKILALTEYFVENDYEFSLAREGGDDSRLKLTLEIFDGLLTLTTDGWEYEE